MSDGGGLLRQAPQTSKGVLPSTHLVQLSIAVEMLVSLYTPVQIREHAAQKYLLSYNAVSTKAISSLLEKQGGTAPCSAHTSTQRRSDAENWLLCGGVRW